MGNRCDFRERKLSMRWFITACIYYVLTELIIRQTYKCLPLWDKDGTAITMQCACGRVLFLPLTLATNSLVWKFHPLLFCFKEVSWLNLCLYQVVCIKPQKILESLKIHWKVDYSFSMKKYKLGSLVSAGGMLWTCLISAPLWQNDSSDLPENQRTPKQTK